MDGASERLDEAIPAFESDLGLPTISPAEYESLNAFYRSRPPLTFPLAEYTATITASWPRQPDDRSGSCCVDITMDDALGTLIVPRSLIKALIRNYDPDQETDHLDPRHLALVLELVLADSLSMLERRINSRIAIGSVGHSREAVSETSLLVFRFEIDGLGSSAGELLLPPGHATRLAQFLDRCVRDVVPEIELAVPVHVRIAATTCSVGEIATLLPGDVVIADHRCHEERTAVAVFAEHLVAPVELTAAGTRLTASPARIQGSFWEWSMASGGDRSQADLKEAELDDIPVKMLFELGRSELSLAEVRQLAPGALIPVQRPLEESVDISANGRRIGRGSLVRIGDNLGVRITRLFHHG
jgi:type III secretion protein Q